MAGYLSPAAYLYMEEQEYLQAYEDVLERYKGMWFPALALVAGLGRDQRGNCYLCLIRATTAWAQVNRCLDQSWEWIRSFWVGFSTPNAGRVVG